jgi:hypothetical protein
MKEEHLEKTHVEKPSLMERLVANMDLVTGAAAIAILVMVIVGVLAPGNPDLPPTRASLAAAAEEFQRGVTETHFDKEAGSDMVLQRREAVSRGWKAVPGTPPEGSAGDVYPRVLVEALRKGQRNEVVFLPPKGLKAEAGRGAIEVRWVEHEDTNVSPRAYAIMRSHDGGRAEQIAEVPGGQFSYRDTGVQPGIRYTYQVASVTDDAILVNQNRRRSELSSPVTIEAVADFKISLVEADAEAGRATFKVEKWQDSASFDKRFTVEVGQEVGALDEGSGVDYTTGRTLASLKAKTESRSRVRREVVFDAEGRVAIEGGQAVTEEVVLVEDFVVVTAALEGGGLPPSTLVLEKR